MTSSDMTVRVTEASPRFKARMSGCCIVDSPDMQH
jgi:hypothetical protein